MKNFFIHLRIYIFRGFLAIIPIALCVFAVRLLYVLIDKRVMGFLNQYIAVRQVPGLGIFLLLASLYFIGVIVSNIAGRQILNLIEFITTRIPFIKMVYGVGKQLSDGLSLTEGEGKAFKKAVLVKLDNTNVWVPAFVNGSVMDRSSQQEMLLVFIPRVPNPATGYIVAVKPSQVIDPGWTREECLKVIMSAGIVAPAEIKK